MAKNLVVCFDGTSNQFGPENTSVVRLVQMLDRNSDKQRLYYDPGLGTLPEPGYVLGFTKKISLLLGLAFGYGLRTNVAEAYSYLMDFWEPGDRVYLFGFSRGAYTARVLAAMLHTLGLLPRGNQNLVPYAIRIFDALRGEGGEADAYWKLCEDFRWTFAKQVDPNEDSRRFPVHFLGIWDTVSSVGWLWNPEQFPSTAHNPSIATIRHAIAIDERRWFYRQNRMYPSGEAQDFDEQWFPGVHSDIGGGYPAADGGLWRAPFQFVVDAARDAGLLIDPVRQAKVLANAPAQPWQEPQHESLVGAWWIGEYFPKVAGGTDGSDRRLRIGRGEGRRLHAGDLISEAAVRRIRDGHLPRDKGGALQAYETKILSPRFLEAVRKLDAVTGPLPYDP